MESVMTGLKNKCKNKLVIESSVSKDHKVIPKEPLGKNNLNK